MTIVASYDWESDTFTHHADQAAQNVARQAFRHAVAEVADKAKTVLPDCSSRVDSAVKMVLAGDVEIHADGTAKVASQVNSSTEYLVVNGTCPCKDFSKAPSGWCKHRIAAGMQKRAQALVTVLQDAPAQELPPLDLESQVPEMTREDVPPVAPPVLP